MKGGETGIRKRGNSYQVIVYAGRDPLTGKQKQVSGTAKTLEEARRLRKRLLAEVEASGHVPAQQMTLGAFLADKFVPEFVALKRPRTQRGYRQIINVHLVPGLGRVRLDRLTREHVAAYLADKRKSGLSERTLLHHFRLLHKALDCAVKWGYVGRNVCDQVPAPEPKKYPANPLTVEEAQRLLDYLKETGSRHYALIATALGTGLRLSELLGLRWADVDMDAGVLHVQQTLRKSGSEPQFDTTKNETGKTVALAGFVKEALWDRWAEYLREKDFYHQDYRDFGLVFCKPNGEPYRDTYISHRFTELLEAAGLERRRFHDLRHTTATLLLKQGVHPKVVQEILGHKTIAVTMDTYSHLMPTMQKEAVQKLDTLLNRSRTT